MKKVSVQELTPGTVIAREVLSPEGVVLLDKGMRLTQAHIASLVRREVQSVFIEEER